MKKTKLKILFTNISRIIMSILFINVKLPKFLNAKTALEIMESSDATCYIGSAPEPTFEIQHVFFILVPIVFLVGVLVLLVKKLRNKKEKK